MPANVTADGAPPQPPKLQYVAHSEFLRRLIARDEATGFEDAAPYSVLFKLGVGAFEESPGRWVVCLDKQRFRFEKRHFFQVDAQMAQGRRAAFIDFLLEHDGRRWSRVWDWFRIHCPYTFARQKDGSWLALNRDYHALYLVEDFICHPADIGVWKTIGDERNAMWLYKDSHESRRGYFTRLHRLLSLALLSEEAAPPLLGNQ